MLATFLLVLYFYPFCRVFLWGGRMWVVLQDASAGPVVHLFRSVQKWYLQFLAWLRVGCWCRAAEKGESQISPWGTPVA